MTALLFALFFIVSFIIGGVATFMVVGLIIREDIRNSEGVVVTFNAKRDKWTIFGDLDFTLNKMRNHYKEPEIFDKAKLEETAKAGKRRSKVKWYRK